MQLESSTTSALLLDHVLRGIHGCKLQASGCIDQAMSAAQLLNIYIMVRVISLRSH